MRREIGAILAGIAFAGCGERRIEFYRGLTIDPTTLKVTLSESVGSLPSDSGRYYFRFTDSRGRIGLTYSDFPPKPKHRCWDHLNLDSASVLVYRSKYQPLARGDFGLVLAQSTYYYAPEYAPHRTDFVVVPNSNMGCADYPTELESAPDTTRLTLHAVSLVQIVRSDTGYSFGSGGYSSDGVLQSFTTGRIVRREGAFPDSVRAQDVGTIFVLRKTEIPVPAEFPRKIDPATIVAPPPDSTVGASVNVQRLVNFHYDRNQTVRQEIDSAGRRLPTRWLRFGRTYADSVLERLDANRSFGLFPALVK